MTCNNNTEFGQFQIKNGENNLIINPLSNDELAENWQLKLPNKFKHKQTYHFSIYLSELPPYLWEKFFNNIKSKNNVIIDNKIFYPIINDNIYTYSIKQTQYDDDVINLYNEIIKIEYNINNINKLYNNLKHLNMKGWINIKTKQILNIN
jgi:hypothetical protein